MKKYLTNSWALKIEAVEVDRETEHSVFINGKKQKKSTEYHCYFDTWKQARDAILNRVKENEERLKRKHDSARQDVERAIMIPEVEP